MREMKDSGVEWIGEIPKDWFRTSLINVLRSRICDGPHETPEITENGIPFISVDSLDDTKYVNLDVAKKSISEELYQEYYKKAPLEIGDILFSKAATIGKTAIVDSRKFMVWSPLAIIKVDKGKCDNLYIYYLLNCHDLIKYVSFLGGYNTQINVGMRALEKAQIPVPSIEEQKRIADYLDNKCAKIDSIIEKQQAIIEKLKEYKLSVITEAVTRGINSNVPMKESGYKWIGKIPEKWEMVYAKQLFTQRKDRAFEGDEQLTSSQKYGIISQKDFMEIEGRQVMQVLKGEEILKHVEKGDFVISMRSFQGGLEYSDISGKISSAYVMLIPNPERVYDRYYKWLFKSKKYITALQGTSNLIRDGQALRFSNFVQVYLPCFEINEQKEIADFLDDICPKIDADIEKREVLLEKIQEYKKSLIYEVVTGKKEV